MIPGVLYALRPLLRGYAIPRRCAPAMPPEPIIRSCSRSVFPYVFFPDGVWLNDNCIQAAVQYTAEYVNRTVGVTLKKDIAGEVAGVFKVLGSDD